MNRGTRYAHELKFRDLERLEDGHLSPFHLKYGHVKHKIASRSALSTQLNTHIRYFAIKSRATTAILSIGLPTLRDRTSITTLPNNLKSPFRPCGSVCFFRTFLCVESPHNGRRRRERECREACSSQEEGRCIQTPHIATVLIHRPTIV